MGKRRVDLELTLETLDFLGEVRRLTKVTLDDIIAVILAIEIIKAEGVNRGKVKSKKVKSKVK